MNEPPPPPSGEHTLLAPPLPIPVDAPNAGQAPASRLHYPSGPSLLSEIARGGMGVVYRAHDPSLGRDLAVKVLLADHADRPDLHRRFIEEARIAGRLQHPGVVPVHEMGLLSDFRPYFTMKLVEGRTLSDLLRERPSPSDGLPRLMQIFEQVCQTIAYAHSKGVIHRDLKPANIMVGAFGEVLVMDWGLAKSLHAHDAVGPSVAPPTRDETQAGMVLGTPAYMPPEQARGEVGRVDEHADVFGLGAILCEILTGRPVFAGETAEARQKAASVGNLDDAFSRLGACGADADLVFLARECLAPAPADRPRDAGAVAARVSAYRAGVADRLHKAELSAAEAQARAGEARARQRWIVVAAALVLLLASSVAGGWLLVARQQAAREHDRLTRRADVASRAQEKLHEAVALREKARAGDVVAGRQARDCLRAAEALLSGEDGDEGQYADVRRQIKEAEDEDRELRLREGLQEAVRFVGVSDPVTGRWDSRHSSRRAAQALREWGVVPGEGRPEEAAASLRRLQKPTRDVLLLTLAVWRWGEAYPGIEFYPGDGGPAVTDVIADSPADKAHVRPGDSLLAVAAGDGSWQDARGWSALRARYWLNAPGFRSLRLRLLGPEEGAKPREVRLHLPSILPWLIRLTDELDRSPWRLACRAADREPSPARREQAVLRLAGRMDALKEPAWSKAEMAYRLSGAGRPGRQLAALRELARFAPGDYLSHVFLVQALPGVSPFPREEATRHLQAALALRPDSESTRILLAVQHAEGGKLDEALALVRAGLKARPKSPSLAWAMGWYLFKKRDYRASLKAYRKSASLPGVEAPSWVGVGHCLLELRDNAQAETAFRKALLIDPRSAAQQGLVNALQRQGKEKEAAEELQRAVRAHPGAAWAWQGLGLHLQKAKRPREAERHFRRAILVAREGTPAAWAALGRFLNDEGRPRDAIRELNRAAGKGLDHAPLWYELARALQQVGRFAEAEQSMRHCLWLKPRHGPYLGDLGVVLHRQHKFASAASEFRRATRAEDSFPEARLYLATALNKNAQYGEAEEAAREYRGAPVPRTLVLVDALAGQGRLNEALAICREAARRSPREHEYQCLLGRLCRQAGKHAEMVKAFNRAIVLQPSCPTPYHELTLDLLERGEFKAAVALAGEAGRRLKPYGSGVPEAAWRATKLLALRDEAAAVAAGAKPKCPPGDVALIAWYLSHQPAHRARAAELFAAAFAAEPGLPRLWRADAIRASIGAGPKARKQALAWLSEFTRPALRQLRRGNEPIRAGIRKAVRNLAVSPGLAPVRDEAALAKLPPDERREWEQFWDEIREALAREGLG